MTNKVKNKETKLYTKEFPNSSQVIVIRHWANNLSVTYKGGTTYTYVNLSKEDLAGAFSAESIGSFLHKRIKPSYGFEKETPETEACIDGIMKQETEKREI